MTVRTAEPSTRRPARYQLDAAAGRLTPAERAVRGKALRTEVPRDAHAAFDQNERDHQRSPTPSRRDG